MRFIAILFFSFSLFLNLSAANSRALEWFKKTDSAHAIPDFVGSVHPDNQVLPIYGESISPEIVAESYSVKLVYPVFQKLNSKELSVLRPLLKNFPDSLDVKVTLGMQRKKPVLDYSFCPFIRKGNTYFKLISFDREIIPVNSTLRSGTELKSAKNYASNSILSTGKWKKISVTESGIYKLTYSDIKNMGLNPDLVQIYGYGGALLEENFSLSGYMDDLPEVAVWKELGSDSIFNTGDFILFYAQGPISWKYNSASSIFSRVRNHYSDKAYYLVGQRAEGTVTPTRSTFSGTPNKQVTSFTDHILYETERVNIGESASASGTGRQLYGEDFTMNASQTFTMNLINPDTTQSSKVQVEFIARNNGTSTGAVYADNTRVSTLYMYGIDTSVSYTYASSANQVASFIPKSNAVNIRLDYYMSGSSVTHRAYLNYINLNVRRFLKMSGSVMLFRDPTSVGVGNIARFTIQNAPVNTVVLDVTNPQSMVQINGTRSGTNYVFNASASTLKEYVCVNINGEIAKPKIEGSVANQNIHGRTKVDMVIISPSEYTSYANTLAQAHVKHDQLNVLVVTPEQVYNEFSSGTPDATAYRRMMKLFYDRAATTMELPKYLLLFGDGVYDNRMVSTLFSNHSNKSNKLLTYQSVESLEGTQSYVTDDYFGFLDDSEGANLHSDKLDIGIGRFPVSTPEQARTAVDKTISYMENARKGVWKNRLLFLADDGDDNIHMKQSDDLTAIIDSKHPEFMINKIYIDAFSKVVSASGSTVPDANRRFAELLNSGLLLLNYTGHGSTSQWAGESLLKVPDIQAMTNKRLPLWVTATCDFTRFDAPETSGGEMVFLNPLGGGIALLTTTRIVYSSYNYLINKSFIDSIFSKTNGQRYSLGQIMQQAKGTYVLKDDRNKLNFTLIGDPALKLAYPEYSARVTALNGKSISSVLDTLRALSKVTVSGKIFRENGVFADDFNGLIYPSVLDTKQIVQTLGSDGSDIFSYYDRSKVLFSGKDSVINGEFSFSFVVPKDISYTNNSGCINFYASDNKGVNEAQGYFEDFILGGTDVSAVTNTVGPDIKLFLNDLNFVSGAKVNETPTLIALVSDENGLNTSGNGIGHDLMLIVDDSPALTFKLNNYYMADIGSDTSGVVQYVLPELPAGKHRLSFRAWDVQNNSNTDTINFVVSPGMAAVVSNIKYSQQGESAWFQFSHNRPEVAVTVKLVVYDLFGRLLWDTNWNMQTTERVSDLIEWNLSDNNGRRLPNGIYLCSVFVTDSNGVQTIESKKIRVAAQ